MRYLLPLVCFQLLPAVAPAQDEDLDPLFLALVSDDVETRDHASGALARKLPEAYDLIQARFVHSSRPELRSRLRDLLKPYWDQKAYQLLRTRPPKEAFLLIAKLYGATQPDAFVRQTISDARNRLEPILADYYSRPCTCCDPAQRTCWDPRSWATPPLNDLGPWGAAALIEEADFPFEKTHATTRERAVLKCLIRFRPLFVIPQLLTALQSDRVHRRTIALAALAWYERPIGEFREQALSQLRKFAATNNLSELQLEFVSRAIRYFSRKKR